MNWEKILGLNVKKLYQSINLFFFGLIISYALSIASKPSNELVIPVDFKTSLFKEGVWQNDSANEFYKIPAPQHGRFELKLTTNDYPTILIISKFSQLFYLLIAGFIFWQVRGLAKTVRDAIPFDKKNIKRIRSVGFAIILLGLIPTFINRYLIEKAKAYIQIPDLALSFIPQDSDWLQMYSYFILGFIFLLIAHVFKKGIELREENALTI